MRKHFLILMLMALLPLAGFAADLDVSKFTAANIPFGTGALGAVSNTQGLVKNTDYTVTDDRFYTSDQGAGETLVTEGLVNNLAKANVGTYYIKVVGIGDYVGGVIYVSFHINGIEITPGNIAAIADQPYSGSAIEPEPAVNVGGKDLVKGTDYTVAWSNNTNVGAVATVTVTGKGNYSGEVAKNFNIVAKAFTTANITVTVTDNEVTYDGTNTQTANVVVADKVLGTLTADKDYTVNYAGGHQNVGNYAITVTGMGNYTGANIVADKQLVIGKATILATPKATKVYDGTKDLPAVAKGLFEYSGFVDALTGDDVDVKTTTWKSDDAQKDVKSGYTVTVTKNDLYVSDNYTIITMPGTFAITPVAIDIYANDQTIEYGASITPDDMTFANPGVNADVWYDGTKKTGDQVSIKKAVIVYVDGDQLKVKANDAATDADKKVLANYAPAYNKKAGADEFGTLTTTKANITIALNSNVKLTKEYDGQPAAIVEDVTDANNLTIIGAPVGTDKLDLSGLKATVVDNTGAVNAAPGYKVTLSGAAVSANADKYTINYVTTYYKVTKKALKVTINTQSAKVGDAIATVIKKDFFTVEGLVAPDTKDDIWELDLLGGAKAGDNIGAVGTDYWIQLTVKAGKAAAAANYSIAAGEDFGLLVIVPDAAIVLNRPAKAVYDADNTLDNADAVIKAAAATKYDAAGAAAFNATLPGAIFMATVLTDAQATKLNGITGVSKTTYVAGNNPANVDDCNLYNATLAGAVKADDNTKYAVTFGDFNMVAEKWYPIVLPFATSVKEVSLTFGYAIVNILKKDNTDPTKIAFKLHMGDIPANEPFVVKVYEDMNMNEAIFGLTPILQRAIEYKDAPEVADASGVKFIGSYSHKQGFAENEAFFSVSADKNDYYWGSDKNNTYMAPLGAYFQIPAGSPARTIIFEEADGSTTAIEAVTSFNAAKKNVEGWYTLNGMKLETAPTQKGIYIKDGKKVVLK